MKTPPPDHLQFAALCEEAGLSDGWASKFLRALTAPRKLKYLIAVLEQIRQLGGSSYWRDRRAPFLQAEIESLRAALLQASDAPAHFLDRQPPRSRKRMGAGARGVHAMHGNLVRAPIWSAVLCIVDGPAEVAFQALQAIFFIENSRAAAQISDEAYWSHLEASQDKTSKPSSLIAGPIYSTSLNLRAITEPQGLLLLAEATQDGVDHILDRLYRVTNHQDLVPGVDQETTTEAAKLVGLLQTPVSPPIRGGGGGGGGSHGAARRQGLGAYTILDRWDLGGPEDGLLYPMQLVGLRRRPDDLEPGELGGLDLPVDELLDDEGFLFIESQLDQETRSLPFQARKLRTQAQIKAAADREQPLHWTQDRLSGDEAIWLGRLIDPRHSLTDSLVATRARAALHAAALFGLSLDAGIDVQVTVSSPPVPGISLDYLQDQRCWRLRLRPPDVQLREQQEDAERPVGAHLLFADQGEFHVWVEQLKRLDTSLDKRFPIGGRTSEDQRKTRAAAHALLKMEEDEPPIPFTRISNLLPFALRGARFDIAPSILLTPRHRHHGSSLPHYLSPEAGTLVGDLRKAHASIFGLLRISPKPIEKNPDNEQYLGAQKCPTDAAVRLLVETHLSKLDSLPLETDEDIFEYHNRLTSYTAYMVAMGLGYRQAIDPRPNVHLLDHSIVLFSDKDAGYHKRLMTAPQILLDHLALYDEHHAWMHQQFPREMVNWRDKEPAYFSLIIDGESRTLRPKLLEDRTRDYFPLPVNSFRRYMRTHLYEAGVHHELSDIWMGHWHVGFCPYQTYSGFRFGDLRKLVETVVARKMEAVGWRVHRSRLLRIHG